MLRIVLLIVLFIVVARSFWRVVDNIVEAASGRPPRANIPPEGVQMARDPVCGTFVVRDRARFLTDGTARVFFCSEACRDKYRADRTARHGHVGGRTA